MASVTPIYNQPPLSRGEYLLRQILENGGGGGGGGGISLLFVDALPEQDIQTNTIYFLKRAGSTDPNDQYDEYVYHDNKWECIAKAVNQNEQNDYIDDLFP